MFRLFVLVACVATLFSHAESTGRMVCYYDSQSYWREGGGKMDIRDLESALSLCNHLVYGFAKINPDNFNLIPFDESKELDSGRGHFKAITNLKNQFPGLRILLSVGGQRDIEDGIKYLTLVETPENRHAFIDSAKNLLKQYKFDGLDLAWQFPEVKIKKERGTFSKLWHSIKKAFGYSNRIKDENEELHRQGFSALLQEAKQVFHREGLLLTAAVLPNVNSEIYFETRPTMDNLDYLTLWAFDFKTPDRNKNEADFPSPLHKAGQRQPNETIEGVVRSWIERPGVDSRKIFLGLQTFARTWKLTEESQISGVPPITSDGPGKEGPLTNQLGYLSYSEVCTKTQNPNQKNNQHLLRLVLDPSHRTGSYSWKLPEGDEEGLWVGFQDVPSLIDKLTYVQTKNLGGVAMVELSADDYKGVCTGTKYPLLRAAKQGI